MNSKRGFTVVELIITMVLLTILLYLAIPQFQGRIQEARRTKIKSDGRHIYDSSIVLLQHQDALGDTTDKTKDLKKLSAVNNIEYSDLYIPEKYTVTYVDKDPVVRYKAKDGEEYIWGFNRRK